MTGPIRIGITAGAALRRGPASPLVRLIREMRPVLAALDARLHIVDASAQALNRYGVLDGYEAVEVVPGGRLEGIVWLVAAVVDGDIDWIIHLTDPNDATSSLPEAIALKRQCVIHGKPYLGNHTAAWEWLCLHWLALKGAGRDLPEAPVAGPAAAQSALDTTIALVAHDKHKAGMLRFAARHHRLLSGFARRLATGTTATLLNGRMPARTLAGDAGELPTLVRSLNRLHGGRDGSGSDWVEPMQSGPMGGDAQIARDILDGRCHRVLFFEDPHVAREHEADIQLMERAARLDHIDCACVHDAATAERWAELWEACLDQPSAPLPVSLSTQWRRRFGGDLVIAAGPGAEAERIRRGMATEGPSFDPPAITVLPAHDAEPRNRAGVTVASLDDARRALGV